MSRGTAVATIDAPALPDVGRLMEIALGQGADGVDALERLVGLQERVIARQAENALTDALGSFQDSCPMIPRTATAKIATKSGAAYSFRYSPLDVIAATIRPHLREHGLSYSFDSALDSGTLTVTCTVRHREGASVSSTFACPIESPSKTSDAQKTGAALTYAKRQSLTAALGLITTEADEDALGGAVTTEPIGEEQLATLTEYVEQIGPKLNLAKFCVWLGVGSLAELPASDYEKALNGLKAKLPK